MDFTIFTTDTFDYSVLMYLALIIMFGTILGKLMEKIKIPAITGYILAGVILGPMTNLISTDMINGLKVLSSVSIGFIAFSIGTELWFPKFKKSGKKIIIITLIQAFVTAIVVFLCLVIFNQPLWEALILAAIATATAPAPIMMIIKRFGAKGTLTDTLIPVTGLDDAVGIIIFGVCISVAKSLVGGVSVNLATTILEPLLEIVASIIFGIICGFILGFLGKHVFTKYNKEDKRSTYLSVILCVVLISATISHLEFTLFNLEFTISSILAPMIAGVVFTNMINKDNFRQQSKAIDSFTPPLMVAFFTLAGAELDFNMLLACGLIGVLYVVGRSIGKIGGSLIGASVTDSEPVVKKYLGLTLLPQGGVEMGLVITAKTILDSVDNPIVDDPGAIIQTVVLAGIFVFEVIGPILTQYYLNKAGELRKPTINGEDLHF